jgi:hypothetical protein
MNSRGLESKEQSLVIALVLLAAGAVGAAEIPDVLKTADGQTVATPDVWEKTRRPEVLELFRAQVFGRNPVERPDSLRFEPLEPDKVMMDGKALRKRISIRYAGPGGEGAIALTAFIPTGGTASPKPPSPAFVLICNRSSAKHIDPDRFAPNPFFPAEEIVARGYAALAFHNGDVDPDGHDGFTNGVHGVFQPDPSARGPDSWGTIAAWAWGASRVMDWIETVPDLIDAKRVAVVGHSRGGKTALWAGATDTRFALTVSNNSGCGGAKLNRMELPKSESIARINKAFPHWFCDNFKRYGDNEEALPVDQHMLVALIAPRLAYVASATLDDWAGQPGEFRSCALASPVWGLYGLKGLAAPDLRAGDPLSAPGGRGLPLPDTPLHEGHIGYHLRTGKHDLTLYDWQRYMDFFDKHGRK